MLPRRKKKEGERRGMREREREKVAKEKAEDEEKENEDTVEAKGDAIEGENMAENERPWGCEHRNKKG